jgi:hypothetical protein
VHHDWPSSSPAKTRFPRFRKGTAFFLLVHTPSLRELLEHVQQMSHTSTKPVTCPAPPRENTVTKQLTKPTRAPTRVNATNATSSATMQPALHTSLAGERVNNPISSARHVKATTGNSQTFAGDIRQRHCRCLGQDARTTRIQ